MLKSYTKPQNVIEFGYRTFKGVIKIKCGYWCGPSSDMTDVYIR